VALILSCGSLYVAKLSYDLSAAKDQREIRDKMPAIDVQVRPAGVSNLDVTISIINRAEINIAPQDIMVAPSPVAGELYFANAQQSIDLLGSSLGLLPMEIIAPKGVNTIKATLSGVTDGKHDNFGTGPELQFTVRIRFADEQDTIQSFTVVRRIRPAK
jgi:hypothetical protein